MSEVGALRHVGSLIAGHKIDLHTPVSCVIVFRYVQ
jgi:hypothetical protein